MQLGGQDYYRAAAERMRDARVLFDRNGSFALSIYSSGLAVECICRAFLMKEQSGFDSRHVIERLVADSRFLQRWEDLLCERGQCEQLRHRESRRLRSAVNDVKRIWSNDYRFASDAKVRSEVVARGLHKGIKGDFLKEVCRRSINAAQAITDTGVILWTSKQK